MSTITAEQQEAIAAFVNSHHLPSGLGTKEEACSIAAINLALFGVLTDRVPDCMSLVIGRWIISLQDEMPDELRNSVEWRSLLPLAAGTGRDYEAQRSAIVINWMWDDVLPQLQPLADKQGFGVQWKKMITHKTPDTAAAAASAAANAEEVDAAATAEWVESATMWKQTGMLAAAAATKAAAAASSSAEDFWISVNPVAFLRELIAVSEPNMKEITR